MKNTKKKRRGTYVPFTRVILYSLVTYIVGIYIGSSNNKEVECVLVDKKAYCGKIIR